MLTCDNNAMKPIYTTKKTNHTFPYLCENQQMRKKIPQPHVFLSLCENQLMRKKIPQTERSGKQEDGPHPFSTDAQTVCPAKASMFALAQPQNVLVSFPPSNVSRRGEKNIAGLEATEHRI